MTVTIQTVRDIAFENPASIRVFEEFAIDYCSGSRKPLPKRAFDQPQKLKLPASFTSRREGEVR
jgi:iron-sulfur cluster repair protein YtfE (RIC family)